MSAQTVTYDFNSYTSGDRSTITDLNLVIGDTSVFPFASQGLSGTQSIQTPGNSFTGGFSAVANAGAVATDTSSDFSFTQSIYFKTTGGDVSGITRDNDDAVILGLTTLSSQSTTGHYANFTDHFLTTAIRLTDSSNRSFQFIGSNLNGSFVGFGATGTLVADSWHLFTSEFAYDSANDEWDITRRVQEADSTGAIVAAGLDVSDSFSLSNPFGANPSLNGFFASDGGQPVGVDHFDNATLAAVPEPSAYALICGVLTLGWITTCRRVK